MPGPYINQAPVDDDSEMRSEGDRPQGTDPQTMAILSRILTLLEAQTQPPPDMGMGMGGPPGMPPDMGMPGMGGPPPGMGMPGMGPPPMPGPGMPPPMPAPGMGPPSGMPPMGPPPGPPGMPGMPPPGLGGGPPLPPPGPEMPFTQYAQQKLGRI